jgi:hypothetical protein
MQRAGDDAADRHPEDADRRQQPLVHLARAGEVLHERHQHALHAGHQDRDAHEPGHHHGAEGGRHEPEPRQDVAEHQDHEDRLRQRREQQEGRLAHGDREVAAQEREEGGHSRSPLPVRWM